MAARRDQAAVHPLDRLTAKLSVSWVGCWEIQESSRDKKGYGRFWLDGRTVKAHRAAWVLLVGDCPEGLEPDHRCRNKSCCNPDHLEWVTQAENTRRAHFRTHCKYGHSMEDAFEKSRGGRKCRKCNRVRSLESYHRRKQK